MKKQIIYWILIFVALETNAQTQIATSNYSNATSNHNQRKIIRDSNDNVYVVFVDSTDQGKVIKGLKLDRDTEQWSNAIDIAKGNSPTISISESGKIHLVFESNDSIIKIKHISSTNFATWSSEKVISDTIFSSKLPVADIDQSGNLNIFWTQENDRLNISLIYACMNVDTLTFKRPIITKKSINDIAIANHLQYYSDVLIFSVQFSKDSLLFLRTTDNMATFDTIYTTIGAKPCVSYNSWSGGDHVFRESRIRMLYIDSLYQLMEIESSVTRNIDNEISINKLSTTPIDEICIDDVIPEIGYSYLFMQNGNLYHGFSYGAETGWTTKLDTIKESPLHPSLAYKNFNSNYIDYIWMKSNGSSFDIFYKRDEKLRYVGIQDYEIEKGFSLTGYPNPFKDEIKIDITIDDNLRETPIVEIYNLNSQLIKILKANHSTGNQFSYFWDGTNQNSDNTDAGMYIILCTVGNSKSARKVIYAK